MCKCMEKAGKQVKVKTEKSAVVMCIGCEKPLQANNGKSYPIHRVPLKIPLEQIETWREQGYVIEGV